MRPGKRLKLISEIKEIVESEGGNVMTLYCLIATMTDQGLKDFHKEVTTKNK